VSRKPEIRWSRLADLDLESAYAFLAERNPEAARRFAADVLEAVTRLRDYPEMGNIARDLSPRGRYRHWVCGHHRIIYRADSETIWILRVWDARRNPDDLIPE
jgi:plasmid stabilization system protein ParE